MARHKPKGKGQQPNRSGRPQPGQVTNKPANTPKPNQTPPIKEKVQEFTKSVADKATMEDIEKLGAISTPDKLTESDIIDLYNKLAEAQKLLEQQTARFEIEKQDFLKAQETHQKTHQELEEKEKKIETKRSELDQRQKSFGETEKRLAEQQSSLNVQSADLERREMEARSGFQSVYKEVFGQVQSKLADYETEIEKLNAELSNRRIDAIKELDTQLSAIRQTVEQELIDSRKQHESRLAADRGALEKERQQLEEDWRQLHQKELDLRREQNKLQGDIEYYNENKAGLEKIIESRIAARVELLNGDVASFRELYQKFKALSESYKHSLLDWEEVQLKVGRDPDVILQELSSLASERNELKEKLKNTPSDQDMERLQALDRKQADWEDERWHLDQQIAELKTQLSRARTHLIEFEYSRDQIIALETNRKVLQQQVLELKADVERRLEEGENESPFPQCYAFDNNIDLQDALSTEEIRDPKSLAKEIETRIARQGLYYSLQDIRSFIGGLAMGRMMILQGISGTGKTSLPIAFAEAVAGGFEVIEVQAGWRDRDDLIGHFNAFEKKFYEKKFLQALYRAQCPAYEDRIFIVLLDEMNLSYPEQYFADLLSVLELRDKSSQKIDLIPRALSNKPFPSRFVNDSRSIRVPPNVWFVGTANQDETTKDIADKTYDRSHIIELPIQHPNFEPDLITTPPSRISFKSFTRVIQNARENQNWNKEAKRTWDFLESLKLNFGDRFGVGWGNRLKGQIEVFLPVVMACGGTWAEATDDILSMKVLRKIRNRYEIQHSDIDHLLDCLDEAWKKSGEKDGLEKGLPKSYRLVKSEQGKKLIRQIEEDGL